MAKKQCSSCGLMVGPRLKVCTCGFVFISSKDNVQRGLVFKPKKDGKEVKKAENELNKPLYSLIFTPAGECPISLEDTSYHGVRRWAGDILLWGIHRRKYFSIDALSYYIRQQVGPNNKEADRIIDDLKIIED